jgi:hypothetical protein
VVDAGSIVSGRRIDLTILDGSLSTSSVNEISLDAQPLSAPSQDISVTNRSANSRVRITIPTRLSDERWVSDILDTEIDSNARPPADNPSCDGVGLDAGENPAPNDGRYIVDCIYTPGDPSTIVLVFEQGVTYDLQMAKIGIGSRYSDEDPAYLTTASVSPRLVALGGNSLAVEVRDRFNAGESGVDVEFELEEGDGSFINDQGQDAGTSHIVTADERGVANVAFKPTSASGPVTISATADLGYPGIDKNETVAFENLAVIGGGGNTGEDDGFNPADSEAFELTSAVLQEESVGSGQGNKNGVVYMTFQNRGSDTSIEAVRINSFVQNAQSANNQKQPAYALIDGTKVDVRGDYVQTFEPGFQVDFTQGQEEPYRAVFYESDGDPYDFTEADFFVYSIRFEDGSTSRYFVVPDAP